MKEEKMCDIKAARGPESGSLRGPDFSSLLPADSHMDVCSCHTSTLILLICNTKTDFLPTCLLDKILTLQFGFIASSLQHV